MVLRRFLRRKLALVGVAILVLLFAFAYLSPHFYRWQFNEIDMAASFSSPSRDHWFGATNNGFDVLALTMRGLQKSLIIGLIGALISTALASVVGAFAGYFRGVVNSVLMALIDLLLVLPSFLIISILSPAFRDSTWLVFVFLLAAFQWMITARIVRGMTLSLREREFVLAARYMGVPGWKVILRHVLPNISSILIIDATVNVSSLVLAEVGLSYFGFGVQPPDISLGTLLREGADYTLTYPWMFNFPAALLVLMVVAVNLVGDGLRDAFDPNQGRASS
jgi:peptide/nickel transport system permease protein